MMKLTSIKAKSIIFTILIVLVPMIILGALGTLYYHDVLQKDVQNDLVKDANLVSRLTASYLDRAAFFLEGQAGATSLVNAIGRQDQPALDDRMAQITAASNIYYWAYLTDTNGNIQASFPYGRAIGSNISASPVFKGSMESGSTYIGSPTYIGTTGKPSVIVATPVYKNNTIIGILYGALDDYSYIDLLDNAMATTPTEIKYIVNRTGKVFVHDDRGCMTRVDNFSDQPVVQRVLRGEEGIEEYVDPGTGVRLLGAYAPVPRYGLGVITAQTIDLAYRPVNDAILAFLILLAALTLFLIGAALLAGNYLTRPIIRMSNAAEEISKTGNIVDMGKYLPYDREDELGGLARAFREMADRITTARDKILKEKKHADMYIDVMGHDINNLNQAILSHLEIIRHYDSLNPQQKECLDGAIGHPGERRHHHQRQGHPGGHR
jgi:methyl-accepting chemotaxis protein